MERWKGGKGMAINCFLRLKKDGVESEENQTIVYVFILLAFGVLFAGFGSSSSISSSKGDLVVVVGRKKTKYIPLYNLCLMHSTIGE